LASAVAGRKLVGFSKETEAEEPSGKVPDHEHPKFKYPMDLWTQLNNTAHDIRDTPNIPHYRTLSCQMRAHKMS